MGPTPDYSLAVAMTHSGSEGLLAGREVICVVFGMQVWAVLSGVFADKG